MLFVGMAGPAAAQGGSAGGTSHGSCVAMVSEQTASNVAAAAGEFTGQTASVMGVSPSNALLQSGGTFCDIPYLSGLVSTGVTLFTVIALVMGFFTWIMVSAAESLPIPSDMKTSLKQQRNSSIAAVFRALFIPAILLTLLEATDIAIPDCVSVLPF